MLVGHKKQWDFLKSKFESGHLAHAYLFAGEEGIGKKTFAREFTGFIGCKFPDLMFVESEEKESASSQDGISISKIREVQKFLSYKSYNGGYKSVIIDSAEIMSQEGQNCFLKTLEEPKGKTILFLITSKPDMLLGTITSRCQIVKFFRPLSLPVNKEKTEKEKKILNEVAPVINSTLAEKFKYVKSLDFKKQDPIEIITALQKHFRKQLLNNFSDKKAKKALEISEEISQKLLFTNANPKLALEVLLMEI